MVFLQSSFILHGAEIPKHDTTSAHYFPTHFITLPKASVRFPPSSFVTRACAVVNIWKHQYSTSSLVLKELILHQEIASHWHLKPKPRKGNDYSTHKQSLHDTI